MSDETFEKIKKKSGVDKDTLISLASMIEQNGLKDENTLRLVINKLSGLTGKKVSKDLEDKIINAVVEDKVPKNIDKLF